jgi:hypothetical protein
MVIKRNVPGTGWKLDLKEGCFEWAQSTKPEYDDIYTYYVYFYPNWLEKKYRYWGLERTWYDGAHVSFGFWFFNLSWSVPGSYKHDYFS